MKSLGQRVHAYKRCFVSGPGACPPKTQTRPLSASPSAPQTTADPITTASSSCPRVSCTENHAGSFVVWAPSAQRHRESHLQSHMSIVHASLLLSRLRRVPVSHCFFLFFVFVFVFLAIRNTAALDVCSIVTMGFHFSCLDTWEQNRWAVGLVEPHVHPFDHRTTWWSRLPATHGSGWHRPLP